jgi:hypothetical protein
MLFCCHIQCIVSYSIIFLGTKVVILFDFLFYPCYFFYHCRYRIVVSRRKGGGGYGIRIVVCPSPVIPGLIRYPPRSAIVSLPLARAVWYRIGRYAISRHPRAEQVDVRDLLLEGVNACRYRSVVSQLFVMLNGKI